MKRFFWLIKRVITQMVSGFSEDRIFENSASLSFYTVLSIVPVLAVLFGIAKGFGFNETVEKEVYWALHNQPDIAANIIYFAQTMLEKSRGGLIGGIGLATLLWTFIGLIGNFEKALNDIWHVKESRSYLRRILDFLPVIILCPLFLIISSSLTYYLSTEIIGFTKSHQSLESVGPYVKLLFQFFPMILGFFIFTFLYMFIPNTKVPWKSAAVAGFFTTLVFQIVQWIYIYFQISISNYGAIYGSFAAIPLFLIWLQLSWLVTLSGAELSYRLAYKGSLTHPAESEASNFTELEIGLYIMSLVIKRFKEGLGGTSLQSIADQLQFHHPVIWRIASQLQTAHLLTKIADAEVSDLMQPGRPIEDIKLHNIEVALEPSRIQTFSLKKTPGLLKIQAALEEYEKDSAKLTSNYSLAQFI